MTVPNIETAAPRVEQCIAEVMQLFPGASTSAQARYFEAVHQELAPLARQLEIELNRTKAAQTETWARMKEHAQRYSWTKAPPTEQGDYWFWNGDRTAAPYACTVLYSGTGKKCFVQMTDTGSGQAEWVDSKNWRGWWFRIHAPDLPEAAAIFR